MIKITTFEIDKNNMESTQHDDNSGITNITLKRPICIHANGVRWVATKVIVGGNCEITEHSKGITIEHHGSI